MRGGVGTDSQQDTKFGSSDTVKPDSRWLSHCSAPGDQARVPGREEPPVRVFSSFKDVWIMVGTAEMLRGAKFTLNKNVWVRVKLT